DAIDPTIVTSRPSRIQTVPSPATTSQWNLDHGSRSRRPGMSVSIVCRSAVAVAVLMRCKRSKRENGYAMDLACRLLGHRYRFRAEGATMRWSCARCGADGGAKQYATAEEAARYARA